MNCRFAVSLMKPLYIFTVSLIIVQYIGKMVATKHFESFLPLRHANCRALMAPLMSPALDMEIDSITALDGTENLCIP